jgi:alpha-L-fucosidase
MAEPEFICPNGCRLTQSVDGKRLYIHLLEYPFQTLQMDCLVGKIEYAQFLHDASEVKFMETVQVVGDKANNTFILPVVKPHSIIPVIEVFLK